MNKKCLILDLDGVILNNVFPNILCDRLKISKSDTAEFFSNDYRKCQTGELDLLVSIRPYLDKWGWVLSTDAFIEYWFQTDLIVNKDLSILIDKLVEANIQIYIASNQEKHRAKYLNLNLPLLKSVSGVFYSYETGCLKTDPKFFKGLQNTLNRKNTEMIYIDNDTNNIRVAKNLGWTVYKFQSTLDCTDYVRRMLL